MLAMANDSTNPKETHPLHKLIVKSLRTVRDPEIPVNIYDLGLIYDLDIDDNANVHVTMTLTTPNCPMAEMIPGQVERAVKAVDGVNAVTVELVWEPVWTVERMTEAAKLELEFTGHTGPGHVPGARTTTLTVGRTGEKKPRR